MGLAIQDISHLLRGCCGYFEDNGMTLPVRFLPEFFFEDNVHFNQSGMGLFTSNMITSIHKK